MPDWDDLMAQCPACEGAGCDICGKGGKLVVASKVDAYVVKIQRQLHTAQDSRHTMLMAYHVLMFKSDPDQRKQLIEILIGTGIYEGVTKEEATDVRVLDRLITEDILEVEDRIDTLRASIESGQSVMREAREAWREAKRVTKRRERKLVVKAPAPRKQKRTKASGKICRFPNCAKDAKEWDEKGRGWCRPHAYARGLLGQPKEAEQ